MGLESVLQGFTAGVLVGYSPSYFTRKILWTFFSGSVCGFGAYRCFGVCHLTSPHRTEVQIKIKTIWKEKTFQYKIQISFSEWNSRGILCGIYSVFVVKQEQSLFICLPLLFLFLWPKISFCFVCGITFLLLQYLQEKCLCLSTSATILRKVDGKIHFHWTK